MNRKVVVNSLVVLGLSVGFAVFEALAASSPASQQAPSSGEQKTFTGTISDSMCGATHMAKDKTPAECTRLCVQQGNKYALVVGKKVYTLEGHEAELNKLAAQKVTVKGTISGNTITVASVAPTGKEKKSHIPSGN